MRRLGAATKRVLLEALGWILVVIGLAALVLPGPGLLGLFAGLAILSQQYEWAERRLEPVKTRALRAAAEGVETWPRIVASVTGALFLVGCGILWIWDPPVPGWWPIHERWWLVGGLGTGLTQIGSGLLAMALVAYSMRRFRGAPD